MFTDTRPTTPVTVRVDHRSAAALHGGLTGLARALRVVFTLVVHAPLLMAVTLSAGWWVTLLAAGHYLTAAAVTAVVGVLAAVLAVARPDLGRRLVAVLVGQAYSALVYRPRWGVACHAADLAPRIGSTTHLPGLVRHTRTPSGVDVVLVRMAPGQTARLWRDAATSLAATFTAHTVTVRPADRPGWVLLDILRRDPLAGERVAPDPARHRATSTTPNGGTTRTRRSSFTALAGRAGIPAMTTAMNAAMNAAGHVPDSRAVVIGRDEYGHPVTINPYTTAHAGMQGATRSGKSSTCYTFLAALAHRPDVIVCGVDPSGLLLGPFTTNHGGRGGELIATGTSREDITRSATVLTAVVQLMDDRIRDLRVDGTDKLTTFTASLPALWVLMEELPGLVAAAKALDAEAGTKAGDRLAPKITAALGRLVKEGAKVGVFVLVLAQRMSADALSTDDRMNLALRITLRVDNADAVTMLHDGTDRPTVNAVRDFATGVALVESPGHPARRVRMYYTDYPTYRARVAAGITATATAPALHTDGTPRADIIGEVITLPTSTSHHGGAARPGAPTASPGDTAEPREEDVA